MSVYCTHVPARLLQASDGLGLVELAYKPGHLLLAIAFTGLSNWSCSLQTMAPIVTGFLLTSVKLQSLLAVICGPYLDAVGTNFIMCTRC